MIPPECNSSPTQSSQSPPPQQQLPEEVLHNIISYLDIPSLSRIIRTSRQTTTSLFSTVLLSDDLWAAFVESRFNISRTKRRPQAFGGATWKAAYRSLMDTHRIPRCRLITGNQKVIFAKPFFGNSRKQRYDRHYNKHMDLSGHDTMAPSSLGVNLWVTLGHTENRNTRITSESKWLSSSSSSCSSSSTSPFHKRPYHCRFLSRHHQQRPSSSLTNRNNQTPPRQQSRRYIELHLCLQNTKSSGGTLTADFSNASAQLVHCRGSEDDGGIVEIQKERVNHSGEYYKPKLLFHSRHNNKEEYYKDRKRHYYSDYSYTNDKMSQKEDAFLVHDNDNDDYQHNHNPPFKLTLKAFDFVIVAVNIPCPPGMVLETDFLSQAVLMNVPVTVDKHHVHVANTSAVTGTAGAVAGQQCNNNNHTNPWWLASAAFLPEEEIWNHYMELPGGCLAGIESDASRALN